MRQRQNHSLGSGLPDRITAVNRRHNFLASQSHPHSHFLPWSCHSDPAWRLSSTVNTCSCVLICTYGRQLKSGYFMLKNSVCKASGKFQLELKQNQNDKECISFLKYASLIMTTLAYHENDLSPNTTFCERKHNHLPFLSSILSRF